MFLFETAVCYVMGQRVVADAMTSGMIVNVIMV